MSDGEIGVTPFVPPADLSFRPIDEAGRRRQRLPWLAMLAAALLHILVLLWLIIDWSHPAVPPPQPEPIPVTVVFAPPKPAPPPKPPAPLSYRESGPDQRTTAPPPAETRAPEAASPPPVQPVPEPPAPTQEAMPLPPAEKPAPPRESAKPKPHKETARLEPPKKEAPRPQAPRLAPPQRLDMAPGERAERGDPYLNRLYDLIEQHRVYPRVMGQFGLPVEGTAVYEVLLARSGAIMAIKLARSSGAPGIDRAAEGMIRNSTPFPPLPPSYPDEIVITISIPLFPPRS